MSLFKYLQLQTVDPQDDGSVSELDQYPDSENFDLNYESSGQELLEGWDKITSDMHE